MRCKQCGQPVQRGQEFCGTCGSPIQRRKKWPLIVGFLAVVLLGVGGYFTYQYFSAKSVLDRWEDDEFVYAFDEQVLREVDARTSETVPNVADLVAEMDARGFGSADVFAPYDLSGNMLDDQGALDPSSTNKYPLYYILYSDANGNDWVVYSNNGAFEANPLFAYDQLGGSVILVEEDYLTSYDGRTNTFIESVPAANEVSLKKVDRIDAPTLSSIKTVEDVEAL